MECVRCGVVDAPHYKNDRKCKPCRLELVNVHRAANIERIRAYDRERGARQSPEYLAEYRAKYPNKYKAHNMVNNAVRDKKLIRECCKKCGVNEMVHAHHNDYLKPMEVTWLCVVHHQAWHTAYGEGANP